MRPIDADALLEQIGIDSDGCPGYYGDTWQFIKTIENASTLDMTSEWIPCSERLPNENEWVLCSCNNGFAILILKLKGKVWHKTESIEYLPKFVNAWMPLPKPWEGANDDI